MNKKGVLDLLSVLLLGFFLLVFFWLVLFEHKTFVTSGSIMSDLINQNYPFKFFYSQGLKKGKLPFWSAEIGNGFPLLAEGQVGALYPLNLLFFYLLPPLLALNFSIFFHYLLAGLFTYLLARSWLRLSPFSALMAGLAFSFSGFMVSHLIHINMIATAAWLPLGFWLLERVLQKPKLWQAIPLALVFSFQFLAGHAEIFYFSSLFLAGYVAIRLFFGDKKKEIWRPLLVLIVGAMMTILFCSPQIIETWQLVQVSDRGRGHSFEETAGMPLPLPHLLTLVVPWTFDFTAEGFIPAQDASLALSSFLARKPYLWETYNYIGLFPLFLAFLAVFLKFGKDRRVRLFVGIFGFSLVLAFGSATPVFKFLWALAPGMKFFKYPTRFLLFTQLSLALLAGVGLECLSERLRKMNRSQLVALLLVGITFVDLFLVQRRVNPTDNAAEWFSTPETAQFLKENLGNYRFYTHGTTNIFF